MFKSITNYTKVYIDGSFNTKTNLAGYGIVMYYNDSVITDAGSVPNTYGSRNVSGEITAALNAVKLAKTYNISDIAIYYDYAGIENWVTGSWRCNTEETKNYRTTMLENMKTMNIVFMKVKAHSGVRGNEVADKLAKQAVGLHK